MLINRKDLIGSVVEGATEEALQPNSIDLTLKSLKKIIDGSALKKKSKFIAVANSLDIERDQCFMLDGASAYDVTFNEHVKVPEGMVAFITHRSTLNRMGGFITSGIYDSGFNNYIGAVLRTSNKLRLEQGARIATIYFIKADNAHLYDGSYQGK